MCSARDPARSAVTERTAGDLMTLHIARAALCAASLLALIATPALAKHHAKSTTPPGAAQGDCDTPTTPFCNAMMKPTPGWKGRVFHLAQDYPASVPDDAQPWLKIDPFTHGNEYLQAVLDFFYEGNIHGGNVEDDFDPATDTVRKWYNAPWQDFGKGGREFIHGLTRERVTGPGELDPVANKQSWNNYAVGFYNAPGGMAIGKVWTDHGNPDATLAKLPDGTVAAKLLFTTAPVAEAPFLEGSPEWSGYVYADPHIQSSQIPDDPNQRKRAVLKLRLLQIDIAVKDSRSTTTGWFMGTFVYGGGPGGPKGAGWRNVAPVGIMWGNDPGYSGSGPLKETMLNPAVHMPHAGYQGRLNGPVDNPASACLSCHMTAEAPVVRGMMPPKGTTDVSPWFQNIMTGTPFDAGAHSTDYSLQISVGIANFLEQKKIQAAPTPAAKAAEIAHKNKLEKLNPREGGSID
jgi:hypothetical protein